jgi:hypothetical protein
VAILARLLAMTRFGRKKVSIERILQCKSSANLKLTLKAKLPSPADEFFDQLSL